MVANIISDLTARLTGQRHDQKTVVLFVKAMQGYALAKVLYLWLVVPGAQAWQDRASMAGIKVRIVLAPMNLAAIDLNLFFFFSVTVLMMCLIFRPGYVSNILFFLVMASLFFIRHPAINGSDYIQTAFALWSIPLTTPGTRESIRVQWIENGMFNMAALILRFQLAFVYLINGRDKIADPQWRSGEALNYIAHIDTMTHPSAVWIFSSGTGNLVLAWATIIFEIGFFMMIWNRHTRLVVLCAGIIFHLFIWWAFTLPDFSLIMILSYVIYLNDTDVKFIQTQIRR